MVYISILKVVMFFSMGRQICIYTHNAVQRGHNVVQYTMILHTSTRRLRYMVNDVKWDFEPTKDTPYLALSGELWDVFCVEFG